MGRSDQIHSEFLLFSSAQLICFITKQRNAYEVEFPLTNLGNSTECPDPPSLVTAEDTDDKDEDDDAAFVAPAPTPRPQRVQSSNRSTAAASSGARTQLGRNMEHGDGRRGGSVRSNASQHCDDDEEERPDFEEEGASKCNHRFFWLSENEVMVEV